MIAEGTEEVMMALKKFLSNSFNEISKAYEDASTPMHAISEKLIATGGDDLSRFENAKICVVIIPESEEYSEGTTGDTAVDCRLTVSFLCRGAAHEVLLRQMYRFNAAFRKAVDENFTLDGKVSDIVLGTTDFYPNTGSVDGQMTAAEIGINVSVMHTDNFDELFV
mgnify:CR=1 FL=1